MYIFKDKMMSKNCIYMCVLLYFKCSTGTIVRGIFLQNVEAYDDTYEDTNSLRIYKEEVIMHCFMKCLKEDRCVSLFYNRISNRCILHEDPFTYTIRSKSGAGWIFFITVIPYSGRCKADFFYHRYLDLCFKFGPAVNSTDSSIAAVCSEPDEELVRVVSVERQSYIVQITADIHLVYKYAICIQGTNIINSSHQWTFNDGTIMPYSKWGKGQPEANGTFIRMYRMFNYKWYSTVEVNMCSYICEYKYNDGT